MTVNINFKPNSQLLNCDFDGYKLKPFEYEPQSKEFKEGLFCNDFQDPTCYLFTRVESLHNHLFSDPFESSSVYFVNKSGHIVHFNYENEFSSCDNVWQECLDLNLIQNIPTRKFSPSLTFASSELLISSNGLGTINVLETGDRNLGKNWKLVKSFCSAPGVLVSSSHIANNSEIHILLQSVTNLKELKSDSLNCNLEQFHNHTSSLFILYWFTLNFNGTDWLLSQEKRIVGAKDLDYISFDLTAEGVILICQSNYSFIFDSNKKIEKQTDNEKNSDALKKKFVFNQCDDSITVHVSIGVEDIQNPTLKIDVSDKSLTIELDGRQLLAKSFMHDVDASTVTWNKGQDGKLEILLIKKEPNRRWPRLFDDGDQEGEELFTEGQSDEISQCLSHLTSEEWDRNPDVAKLAFNTGQFEECDDAANDVSLLILDGNRHKCTHSSHLGSVQHLLNVHPENSPVTSFCLRHDVDGIVWRASPERTFEHVSTFNAFGYVKASKTLAKFTQCASDYSYVAVSDVHSHVYVFFQCDQNFNGELKNRKSGKVTNTIASQFVISLKTHDEVMGFHTAPKAIFVLTKSHLFIYKF